MGSIITDPQITRHAQEGQAPLEDVSFTRIVHFHLNQGGTYFRKGVTRLRLAGLVKEVRRGVEDITIQ